MNLLLKFLDEYYAYVFIVWVVKISKAAVFFPSNRNNIWYAQLLHKYMYITLRQLKRTILAPD